MVFVLQRVPLRSAEFISISYHLVSPARDLQAPFRGAVRPLLVAVSRRKILLYTVVRSRVSRVIRTKAQCWQKPPPVAELGTTVPRILHTVGICVSWFAVCWAKN